MGVTPASPVQPRRHGAPFFPVTPDPQPLEGEWLQLLIDQGMIAVFETSLEGEIVSMSLNAAQLLGFPTVDEALASIDNIRQVYADPEQREALVAELRRTGEVRDMELLVRRADEELRWFLINASLVASDAGARLVGTLADITDRRAEEERRRHADARYKTIFETGAEAIWLARPDAKLLTMNPAAARMLGYDSPEAALAAVDDVRALYVDVEQREVLVARVRAQAEVHGFEVELRHRDGGSVSVSLNVGAIRDKEGDVLALVSMAADIRERKAAEEALRGREQRQSALAELGQYALADFDLDRLFALATGRLGSTLGVEFVKVLELEPGGQKLRLRAGWGWRPGVVGTATVPAGPGSQAGYTLFQGEPVVSEDLTTEERFRAAPLLTGHGVMSGMTAVIGGAATPFGVLGAHSSHRRGFTPDDVAFLSSIAHVLSAAIQRRRSEQTLREALDALREADQDARHAREAAEAQRLRTSLFSSITHDVRTPLTAITMAASTLKEAGPSLVESERAILADQIESEAQRLRRLVDNVLTLARARADAITLDRRPVAVDELVQGVVDRLQPLLARHTIELDLTHNIPDVQVDIVQLDQALTNVIENAAKYSEGDTAIAVSTRRTESDVEIRVDDQGPGIPKAERRRVLEPFIRGTGQHGTGSGLGLAIARAVLEGHGGGVQIEDSPSGGAAVILQIPCGY